MEGTRYITTTDAANFLHITGRRVIGLCRSGELEGAVQEGRRWKIPEESILELAEKRHLDVKGRMFAFGSEGDLKPCAVGNTSYIDVAKDCYYVDKTLLIKELIDDRSMVTLFARPRRFGKTLALSMLRTYFEVSDEDTSVYFQDKKIWVCGERYQKLQGQYPVIYLTFKDVKFNAWKESLEGICLTIIDEFRRHGELGKSSALDASDLDYYQRVMKNELSEVEYQRSLLTLTRMLRQHFGQKVVILIDEYDTPIQQGFMKGFYHEIISFMRNFLTGGLKDNANLAFGVLTGILRVSKENLFSGLNNLAVNTILDKKYSTCFGFTEEEVRDMALYYRKEDKLEEIQEWYDGYRFGNSHLYNPWSVSNYFYNDCEPKNFWVNTSDNEILQSMLRSLTPEIAEELLSLMQGKQVSTFINTEIIYPRISDGTDAVFSFLLMAGYLTPVSRPEETESGTFADLKLPNLEIRRVYNAEILSWVKGNVGGNAVTQIEKSLYQNNAEQLQQALQKYMLSCISYFDGAAEGFYHGMVLGLVASLSSRYYIRSNRESGEGRFDLQLEPKMKILPGIIMEFKSVDASRKNDLKKEAEDALKQIETQKYDTEMRDRGIQDIVRYGIVFSGKHVEVLSQK